MPSWHVPIFWILQSPSYDSGGIYESEAGLKEGVVGIYNLLYMEGTFTNSSHRPAVVTIDNFTGLSMERAQNTTIGAGSGCTPDNSSILAYWSGLYKLVARANAVIYGASGNIENMSDEAKRYYAEARVLRAYAYYNLVVAFGDVPFFTKPATTEDYNASHFETNSYGFCYRRTWIDCRRNALDGNRTRPRG